ncbi:MAG: hypothetical protein JXB14_03250, partial [Candidatus Altiarchaeota archaeon]|nr:hypothetical protein [Candidatus Altiarchaeota archaeon]
MMTNVKYKEPEGWSARELRGGFEDLGESAGLKEAVIAYDCPWDPNTFIQFLPELPMDKGFSTDYIWKETIRIDKEHLEHYK